MSDVNEGRAESATTPVDDQPPRAERHWKPVLTLLVLAPAVGELLSGSSPPLQFFNPVSFVLLVGLYGCGALLVRELVVRRGLNAAGLLLLGAAYGIIEEGLMCKSFFNPYWTDTGFLSIYGRAAGVNWVWAFGLTFYHMAISITAPVFITEAAFSGHATVPWLRRRGQVIAGSAFALVVLLGFAFFDNRPFHLIEMEHSLELARQVEAGSRPLDRFIAGGFSAKHGEIVRKAVATQADSVELKHALQEELNRLLPRPELYSPERFAGVPLPARLREQMAKRPQGDKLVEFNRGLLEAAFPGVLPVRQVYPFRLGWPWTLGCLGGILALVGLALQQTRATSGARAVRAPWFTGVGFTAGFVMLGFIVPSIVEHGGRFPAWLLCGMWVGLGMLLGMVLRRLDGARDRTWRRGLWAIGAISPWVLFALLLGLAVGVMGAKSFLGMPWVALGFGSAMVVLARAWKRRSKLELGDAGAG